MERHPLKTTKDHVNAANIVRATPLTDTLWMAQSVPVMSATTTGLSL